MTDAPQTPLGDQPILKVIVIAVGALWIGELAHAATPPFVGFPFEWMTGFDRRWTPPVFAWFVSMLPGIAQLLQRRFGGRWDAAAKKLETVETSLAHKIENAVHHSPSAAAQTVAPAPAPPPEPIPAQHVAAPANPPAGAVPHA